MQCVCPPGGRSLLDVRARKQQNAEMQRFIATEAEEVDLDMMKQEMDNKAKVGVQCVDAGCTLVSMDRGYEYN